MQILDSYFTGIASAMQVISKISKNPERTPMLINLLNTDKVLYNLIANGIEGKHYVKKDDKYIEPIKYSGYCYVAFIHRRKELRKEFFLLENGWLNL